MYWNVMLCQGRKRKLDCCDESEVGLIKDIWEEYIPYEDSESSDNETWQEIHSCLFYFF
jgi:hypothetical protein